MEFGDKEFLIRELYDNEAIRFGEFPLKSGLISPVYVDLRGLGSTPSLLRSIGEELGNIISSIPGFDLIGAIPYAGIPIAVSVALCKDIPMIYYRKEVKEYGTKQTIEGRYEPGQKIVIVDDVITDGQSKFNAMKVFLDAGLCVEDIAILVDRQQGGKKILESKGYKVHSLLTLQECLDTLYFYERIDSSMKSSVLDFLRENQFS